MQPLETYLDEMRLIHSSGANTPETSYYPTLANLLNEVGKTLKPRVRCIMGLRDQGAGLPDGGLFTPEQFPRSGLPPANTIPTRGAIEVKPAADNSWQTAAGAQVTRYGQRYGHVLVTNYRDFLLVGPNAGGVDGHVIHPGLGQTIHPPWRAACRYPTLSIPRCEGLYGRPVLALAGSYDPPVPDGASS